jgi:hypothetical protein
MVVVPFDLTDENKYPPLVFVWPLGYHTTARAQDWLLLLETFFDIDQANHEISITFTDCVHYQLRGLTIDMMITLITYTMRYGIPVIITRAAN